MALKHKRMDVATTERQRREDQGYSYAIVALDLLMSLDPSLSKDEAGGVLLGGLAAAIDDYEQMRWPFAEPTPEEATAFRREQEAGLEHPPDPVK